MKRCRGFVLVLCAGMMILAMAGCSDEKADDAKFTIIATAGSGGSINPSGSVSVAKGADRTFTMSPNAGYVVDDVEVDGVSVGAQDSYTFENVQSNHEILALFRSGQEGYTLTVAVEGQGSVAKSPDQVAYDDGTVVTLTAISVADWEFDHWEGNLIGTDNPADITMDSNKAVTAVFTQGEYTLEVTIDGSGSVTKDPDRNLYGSGAVVTLTAAGDPGWAFDNWTGDANGTGNPVQVTMNDNKAVTAHFVEESYILQVFVDGGGEVTWNPVQASYSYGDVVTITATPDAGWEFDHWDGDVTGADNPLELTMDSNKVVTAYFVQAQYELVISIDGEGTVAKDPDQATYTLGTQVTITATGGAGHAFDRWEGDYVGTDNPHTVTIEGDTAITAYFVEEQYTLEVVLNGSGTVTKNPDQATYTYGTDVILTAAAGAGWEWGSWSGDASGSANPVTVTMNGNKTVTANFIQNEYTLTVNVNGAGSVAVDPALATYPADTVVTLTANPDTGAVFDHWEGDVTGNASPAQLTMNSDKTVTAYFTLPTILLVDDDGTDGHQAYYTAALDLNGFDYDVWNVNSSGAPDRLALMDYNIVIWMTGEEYENTITSTDMVNLGAYLDCGGRLFLCGHDLLQGAGGMPVAAFFTDYIHITGYNHDARAPTIVGTDDEVSVGMGSITLNYPFTDYTDTLTLDSVATVSFNKSGGGPVGVKSIAGNYRTVFFAFPFEAVANTNASTAGTLMANIINFLATDISSSSQPPTCTITSPAAGAEVAGYTNITVDLGESSCVSHVNYNVDGGAWVTKDTPPFNYVWDSREVTDMANHTICAQAFDFNGNSSDVDCVEVFVNQSAIGPMSLYSVISGISDYPGGGDLQYCDEDATDWFNYLDTKGYVQEVYGDGHPNNFPQYDGLATLANLREAVRRVSTLADENDVVVLVFSGHGTGNGSGNSAYCAHDQNYNDDVLADDLDGATAGHVFVFFDSCFSGGMGPELMNLNSAAQVHVSCTCSEDGYGYDQPSYQNGAWTYWFVDAGLKNNFSYNNVATEECHLWADNQYNPGGGDDPEDYDSDPSIPLHLAEPPWPKISVFIDAPDVVQKSYWADSVFDTRLAALLEGTAKLEVFRREEFYAHRDSLPTATLTRPELIQPLLAEVNTGQRIKDRVARCWFGYSMDIKDAKGNDLGMLGMCYSPTGYYQDHPAVFVMPREDGKPPVRYGLNVPDGAALVRLIEDQL